MITLKTCTKCGLSKPLNEFRQTKAGKNGTRSECKECELEYSKIYCAKNKEKRNIQSREWRLNNPKKARLATQRWREASPEKIREYSREYRVANLEKCKEREKKWKEANSERILKNQQRRRAASPESHQAEVRKWQKSNPEKCKENQRKANARKRAAPKGKISDRISKGIWASLKNGSKAGRHWETLVDFTINQLRKHLERQFDSAMTWGNYGSYWHIDHKIPIAVFNFETPEDIDFKRCWALKNLQPLEAIENIKKSAKIGKTFQPSLLLRLSR